MNKIPENYRKLKPDEILKAGDLYHLANFPYNIDKLTPQGDIRAKASKWPEYDFFRRKHTKKQITKNTKILAVASVSKTKSVKPTNDKKKAPKALVGFHYLNDGRSKYRNVQVISLDDTYLIGLERTLVVVSRDGTDSTIEWKFKKFSVDKIRDGEIYLLEYK